MNNIKTLNGINVILNGETAIIQYTRTYLQIKISF